MKKIFLLLLLSITFANSSVVDYLEKIEMSLYNKSKWSKKVICSKIDKLSFEVKNQIMNEDNQTYQLHNYIGEDKKQNEAMKEISVEQKNLLKIY